MLVQQLCTWAHDAMAVLPYICDNSVASLCLTLPSLGRNLLLVRSRAHQSWQGCLHRCESCSHHTSSHPGSSDQMTHIHMSFALLRHRNCPSWSSSSCAEHNQTKQQKLCYWSTKSLQPGKKTHTPEITKVYLDCERVQSNLNCKMFRKLAAGDEDLSFSVHMLHRTWRGPGLQRDGQVLSH